MCGMSQAITGGSERIWMREQKSSRKKHLSPSRRRGSRSLFVKLAERCNHKGKAGHTGALTAWKAFHPVKGFLAFGIFFELSSQDGESRSASHDVRGTRPKEKNRRIIGFSKLEIIRFEPDMRRYVSRTKSPKRA